jgi:uncharacterized membrane protein YqjE
MFESLRSLLAHLLELLQVRLELLTTELSSEVRRAALVLLYAFIALVFGALSLLLLAVTVVIALWNEHRLLAAAIVTGVFLAITATALWQLARRLRGQPRLLAGTLDELRRDREALQGLGESKKPGAAQER